MHSEVPKEIKSKGVKHGCLRSGSAPPYPACRAREPREVSSDLLGWSLPALHFYSARCTLVRPRCRRFEVPGAWRGRSNLLRHTFPSSPGAKPRTEVHRSGSSIFFWKTKFGIFWPPRRRCGRAKVGSKPDLPFTNGSGGMSETIRCPRYDRYSRLILRGIPAVRAPQL